MTEVLVGRDDPDLLDPFVCICHSSGCTERVVGLVGHHWPDGKSGRDQGTFHDWNLQGDLGGHALAGLVTSVEVVPEAFDRVIRGDGDVRRAIFDEGQC